MTAAASRNPYTPQPEHHFTFGLWTVGNIGRDPFGEPVRAPVPPVRTVQKLSELGAYGVNLHDNDLVPAGASASERGRPWRPLTWASSWVPARTSSGVVAKALDAGKLFHIDLNDQKPGRFDQDLRFGSDDPKGAFFLVKPLEDAAWPGMRHFDSHAYRTEADDGVWAFAAASMRSYQIFKEKVERFNADPEIQQILGELACNPALEGFTLPKVLWLRNHEPAAFSRLATMLLAKDYIRFRLTGTLATEPSDASGTLMYDVVRLR